MKGKSGFRPVRVGCHWCGEAYEILRRAGYEVDEVSIEDDSQLLGAYGDRVPVVVIEGQTVAEGPSGLRGLPAVLEARQRSS